MQIGEKRSDSEPVETQLETIRDLMIEFAARGAWLTLGEIAEYTQFGEASISAQLRHLRKPKHGRYCVEKRIREPISRGESGAGMHPVAGAGAAAVSVVWEYRIATSARAAQECELSARPNVSIEIVVRTEPQPSQHAQDDAQAQPSLQIQQSFQIQQGSEPCHDE